MKSSIAAIAVTASMLMGGVAFAQSNNNAGASGDTSGAASGGNVNPSTSVQKNRSSATDQNAPSGGGAAGVEGPKGSENGAAQTKDSK